MATRLTKSVKDYVDQQTQTVIAQTRKYKVWVILLAIFCVIVLLSMLFGGWSIKDYKQQIRELKDEQKILKAESERQKEINIKNHQRDSVLISVYEVNQANREKVKTKAQLDRDEAIKKIFSPDFSSNDDSIRNAFRSGY